MQLAERADWATSAGVAALFALPFAVSSGTGGYPQVVPFQSTGNTVLFSSQSEEVGANPLVADIAVRLNALLSTYSLNKTQLASILSVSRPTLDGWLSQSVDTIRQGNQDRLAAIEQTLQESVPAEDADHLGAFLQRKLEEDSAVLLAELSAETLNADALSAAFAPVADALDGMRRSQELDRLLGEDKAPFI